VDRLAVVLATIVPGILAIVVVAGWIIATISGVGTSPDLRDAAIAVLAFYFGGVIHSNGVASGANAANGITAG
jgi:hypothetical protein